MVQLRQLGQVEQLQGLFGRQQCRRQVGNHLDHRLRVQQIGDQGPAQQ